MGFFNKMSEPIVLRESHGIEDQLAILKELYPMLNQEGQAILEKDIKCLEYGIIGEKSILFELKNSHMPMYILQDIYLQDGELSAQIDFMVFTRKICFVIECKNLYGDLQITKDGSFIRTITVRRKKIKEGIYSPITQNERHIQLMKKIKKDKKNNVIMKMMLLKYFEEFNRSIVVLANPKTVIDTRYAKKEVKDQVIRVDQLIEYIKEVCSKSKELESSDEEMLRWAESYLELHQEVEKNYTKKYESYRLKHTFSNEIPIEETEIYQELKKYRLNKSKEEKVKPYVIYNNKELEALIRRMPTTLNEIEEVYGFGKVKVSKYGVDILRILEKFQGQLS